MTSAKQKYLWRRRPTKEKGTQTNRLPTNHRYVQTPLENTQGKLTGAEVHAAVEVEKTLGDQDAEAKVQKQNELEVQAVEEISADLGLQKQTESEDQDAEAEDQDAEGKVQKQGLLAVENSQSENELDHDHSCEPAFTTHFSSRFVEFVPGRYEHTSWAPSASVMVQRPQPQGPLFFCAHYIAFQYA